MKINRFMVGVALALTCSCMTNAKEKVLCFGDSITYGTHIKGKYTKDISWVSILQGKSNGRLECINAGRSGRTAGQWRQLAKYINKNKAIDHLIIFLGVNDLRKSTEEVLHGCVNSVGEMVKLSRKAYGENIKILILSSPGLSIGQVAPVFHKMGFDANEQEMLDRLRGLYAKYAKENRCDYLDLWGVISPENYHDGLHPTLKGQEQMADVILKKIMTLKERP